MGARRRQARYETDFVACGGPLAGACSRSGERVIGQGPFRRRIQARYRPSVVGKPRTGAALAPRCAPHPLGLGQTAAPGELRLAGKPVAVRALVSHQSVGKTEACHHETNENIAAVSGQRATGQRWVQRMRKPPINDGFARGPTSGQTIALSWLDGSPGDCPRALSARDSRAG